VHRSIAAGVVALTIAGLLAVGSQPADAIAAPIKIAGTGGSGVNMRSTPDTSRAAIGKIPEGARPNFICFAHGQNIYGVNVWFKVKYGSVTGYYASYYDNSSYTSDFDLTSKYGIPLCNSSGNSYARSSAANWASGHARDVQVYSGSQCAWFVSQALWAGTLQKTYTWTSSGSFFNPDLISGYLYKPGTPTAWNVASLVSYLRSKYSNSSWLNISSRFATNSVPEAAIGDVIVYDWYNDGTLDHMSLVTNIASNSYPEVSEWGISGNAGSSSSYVRRGWTWSQNSGKWLQQVYPNVRAYLLHVVAY
jgi:uncharacterized protein YraI